MTITFEDATYPAFAATPEHPFYCFYSGTMHNSLPIEPHWHFYIEILYCTTGKGYVIINGQKRVFQSGEMLWILPRDVHAIYFFDDQPFEYGVIKYDPAHFLDHPSKALRLQHIQPFVAPVNPTLKHYPVPPNLGHDFRTMITHYKTASYGYELIIKAFILSTFYEFVTSLKDHGILLIEPIKSTLDQSTLMPAFAYISTHYKTPLTAKAVARHCHLSDSYFSRQFKKVSGFAFTVYLNRIRITEAEKLLLAGQTLVTDIAYQVGYTDTSYFIKQFRTYKKITPKQFMGAINRDLIRPTHLSNPLTNEQTDC